MRNAALTVDQLTDGFVRVLLAPQGERGHVAQQTRADLVAVDGASPEPHVAKGVAERDAQTVRGHVLHVRDARRRDGGRNVAKELVAHQETPQRSHGIETLQRGREVARVSGVDDSFPREVRRRVDDLGFGERQGGRGGMLRALRAVIGIVNGVAMQ